MKKKYDLFSAEQPVAIPIIQRDYVQGADVNARRRDKFLKALLTALLSPDKDFEIDFIYGSADGEFVPVDGQQRLTTLMLLGWLLNQRAGGEYSARLPRMTYHTRPSTEQFLARLLNYTLPGDYEIISRHILNVPGWFAHRWREDSSIMAMLDFLDKADSMLNEAPFKENIDTLAHNFFNDNPVTFEFLDMKAMSLNDDLYIKMNARGKALTPFENWKAQFQQQLKQNFKGVEYKYGHIPDIEGNPTLLDYFVYAIEHSWTDMLWHIALPQWEGLTDEQKREQSYPRTDELFMNIFNYVSRLLYFTTLPDAASLVKGKDMTLRQYYDNNEEDILSNLYAREDNVETLFRILDFFVEINKLPGKSEEYFGKLFTNEYSPETRSTRVNLYASTVIDLFDSCISSGLEAFTEMLLWAILRHSLDYPGRSVGVDYARIVTSMLRGRRQNLKNGLEVRPSIRYADYHEINKSFDELLADADVHQAVKVSTDGYLKSERENEKMRGTAGYDAIIALSGHPDLYYCFDALRESLGKIATREDAERYVEKFIGLMDMRNPERIRLLNGYGYRGVVVNDEYYFYGAPGKWDFIFTSGSKKFAEAFTRWIADESPDTYGPTDWAYYVGKYKPFIKAVYSPGYNSPHYYFMRSSGSIFTAWALKTYSSRPIMGYNTCPFAFTVMKEYRGEKLRLWAESYYSDHGVLYVNDPGSSDASLTLECLSAGWKISVNDGRRKIARRFLDRYAADDGYIDTTGEMAFSGHVLLDLPGADRIETALKFLATIE